MLRRSAGQLAAVNRLPTSARAVLGYYADTGVFDAGSLRVKRRVDAVTDRMIDEAFDPVESRVAEEFDRDAVTFAYDTKLVLPAQLTLGYLYRNAGQADRDRAEAVTRLAIEALIDGDMRDARNDDEYEDFDVDFPADEDDRATIARIAQETLQTRVERRFEEFDDGIRDIYDWAVDVSEGHQDDDDHFRDLLAAATDGDPDAAARIRGEYKFAAFDDEPDLFEGDELDLPYFKTQYDRVGVIYDGMVRMYGEAGFSVPTEFTKSIVMAIVGAQLWLDDVDDYRADMREGQLTPVTAEYVLAEEDRAAYRTVVDVSETYLDLAREYATAADSPLNGVATEYIYRSGTPDVLPGSR